MLTKKEQIFIHLIKRLETLQIQEIAENIITKSN